MARFFYFRGSFPFISQKMPSHSDQGQRVFAERVQPGDRPGDHHVKLLAIQRRSARVLGPDVNGRNILQF